MAAHERDDYTTLSDSKLTWKQGHGINVFLGFFFYLTTRPLITAVDNAPPREHDGKPDHLYAVISKLLSCCLLDDTKIQLAGLITPRLTAHWCCPFATWHRSNCENSNWCGPHDDAGPWFSAAHRISSIVRSHHILMPLGASLFSLILETGMDGLGLINHVFNFFKGIAMIEQL